MKDNFPTLEETIEKCLQYYEHKIDVYKRANVHSSAVDECIAHTQNLNSLLSMIQN